MRGNCRSPYRYLPILSAALTAVVAFALPALAGHFVFAENHDLYIIEDDGTDVYQLTDNLDTEPEMCPNGTLVAFRRYVTSLEADGEIYVVDTDGDNATNLTNNSAKDIQPDCGSPVGGKQRILFASDRDGNYEIYLVKEDGTGLTRLTNNSAFDSDPAWCKNRVVFVSTRNGGSRIFIMDANGDNVEELTDDGTNYNPSCTSGGDVVAFSRDTGGSDGFNIFTMDSDGTDLLDLETGPGHDTSPNWSPGNNMIGYYSTADDEIKKMNANGTSQQEVPNTSGGHDPDWGELQLD